MPRYGCYCWSGSSKARGGASCARHRSDSGGLRGVSLDVFRGLTMILLLSHGFGLLEALKGKEGFLASQLDHALWVGCTLWDLIQPAFTFIVGAAMPFAVRSRMRKGEPRSAIFRHVVWRAVLLIVRSNVLSNWNSSSAVVLQESFETACLCGFEIGSALPLPAAARRLYVLRIQVA